MHNSRRDGRRHEYDIRDEGHERPNVLGVTGARGGRRAVKLALVIGVRPRCVARRDIIRRLRRLDSRGLIARRTIIRLGLGRAI
eukprot:1949577-Pleurochrysis_carterae.AAC.1